MANRFERDSDGQLSTLTSLGAYPLYYVDAENNALCADCANEQESEAGNAAIVASDANWEDPEFYCDGCSKRIPSAYADDED